MNGKIFTILIVIATCAVAAGMYYAQVYAYYYDIEANGESDVMLTPLAGGAPVITSYSDFQAIDRESSPLAYRACFYTDLTLPEAARLYEPYEGASPRVTPHWFTCYQGEEIGAQIEAGRAHVFTGKRNIEYGIDRVVAITDQGRGYVWHEINDCGDKACDGSPLGEDGPPREEFTRGN